MPEIWSIALTREGIGACAMSPDGESRQFSAPWPVAFTHGIRTLEPAVVQRLLAHALQSLSENASPPMVIGLCAPDEETAIFMDGAGRCQTPLYWDEPLAMPRREIPAKYASDPALASAYRNSVLRRLQQHSPLLGDRQTLGLLSLGALVAYWLTGHPCSSTQPRGVPVRFPAFEEEDRMAMFEAMGICADCSAQPVKCGHVFARITPEILENLAAWDMPKLSALAGIPVFELGASEGARAYASAANPLSWAACVGWQTHAHWTASTQALAEFEIQIIDKTSSEPSPENSAKRPEDLSADDWTMLWSQNLPLDIHAGPRRNLMTYGIKIPAIQSSLLVQALQSLLDDTGHIPFKKLSRAPLGSGGLHLWHGAQGWQMAGFHSAHTPEHLARACFESQIYAIRQNREALGYEGCGPIRLMLAEPWPVECAQWAADILNAPVIYIEKSSQEQAAFGAAIALIRELDMKIEPHLAAIIVEPQERAAYYEVHYRIHQQLISS